MHPTSGQKVSPGKSHGTSAPQAKALRIKDPNIKVLHHSDALPTSHARDLPKLAPQFPPPLPLSPPPISSKPSSYPRSYNPFLDNEVAPLPPRKPHANPFLAAIETPFTPTQADSQEFRASAQASIFPPAVNAQHAGHPLHDVPLHAGNPFLMNLRTPFDGSIDRARASNVPNVMAAWPDPPEALDARTGANLLGLDAATRDALLKSGADSAQLVLSIHVRYGDLGIPINADTVPSAVVHCRLQEHLGRGNTGSVYRVMLPNGETIAFKPSTGKTSLSAKQANIDVVRPNLEGRAMLSAAIGARFIPAGCGLTIPASKMLVINNMVGLAMDLVPGKSRAISQLQDVRLLPDSALHHNLQKYRSVLENDAHAMRAQCNILGLQQIRFVTNKQGTCRIHVSGAILKRSPADVLAHPSFKRALTWLQLFDLVTGQMDRHSGNIFVHVDRSLTGEIENIQISGIDNEQCAGPDADPARRRALMGVYAYFCCLYPVTIDTEMLAAVRQLGSSGSWLSTQACIFLTHQNEVLALGQRVKGLILHCENLAKQGKVIGTEQWSTVIESDPVTSLPAREMLSAQTQVLQAVHGVTHDRVPSSSDH